MTKIYLSSEEKALVNRLVGKYQANYSVFTALGRLVFDVLTADPKLSQLVHSIKYRVKDPSHLKEKLERKLKDSKEENKPFTINEDNLFQTVNDLIGVRILHLHTTEVVAINTALQDCLSRENYKKSQGPTAKVWDDEAREYFSKLKFEVEKSKNHYTSVHYVFDAQNVTKLTLELQVRTLAEELWGEVDHLLNYPKKHKALACREQLAVLARTTSACTRLVDAIFRVDNEFAKLQKAKVKRPRREAS